MTCCLKCARTIEEGDQFAIVPEGAICAICFFDTSVLREGLETMGVDMQKVEEIVAEARSVFDEQRGREIVSRARRKGQP